MTEFSLDELRAQNLKELFERDGFTDVSVSLIETPEELLTRVDPEVVGVDGKEWLDGGKIKYFTVTTTQGSFGTFKWVYAWLDLKGTGATCDDLEQILAHREKEAFKQCEIAPFQLHTGPALLKHLTEASP